MISNNQNNKQNNLNLACEGRYRLVSDSKK